MLDRRRMLEVMLVAPVAAGLARSALAAETAFVNIGSGSTRGLYYPTASSMADIINDAGVPMRAYVHATGASVDNCLQVGSGASARWLVSERAATLRDPRWYLYDPRDGYRWVRDDSGTYMLVSIATGIISDILSRGL